MYDGPIIDPHQHLWDLSMARHAWLGEGGGTPIAGLEKIRHDMTVDTYRNDAANQRVVATVHIEALWDAADPVGETRWLDTLDKSSGVAVRYTAAAPLGAPHGAAVLEQQAAFPRVAAIRQILSHHPAEPGRSFAARGDLALDPAWRRDVARLAPLGLMLELMMYHYQTEQVVALARAQPALPIVVNHCASPIDRDADGMRRWRESVTALAAEPNIALKVSNATAYDPRPTDESLYAVMRHCIDSFGPSRTMIATDWPVAKLFASFDAIYATAFRVTADFSAAEQRALFHDNAARLYRIDRP